MTKGLEALDRIFNYCEEIDNHTDYDSKTGYRMLSDVYIIKKELQVLGVIKKKYIRLLSEFDTYDDYFEWAYSNEVRLYLLSREEFELLKEVFVDE